MDRFNVAVAALTMNRALGLSATTYGLGAGAFFRSYCRFRGADACRGAAVDYTDRGGLGACSAGTALASGVASFVLARFLLGIAEAGFFPGSRSS